MQSEEQTEPKKELNNFLNVKPSALKPHGKESHIIPMGAGFGHG
jgi:hypothetical protein